MLPDRHTITLEITTRCNLTCVMCPHGLPAGMPNKRDAGDALIDILLGQAHRYKIVQPTGVGEPLMAPGFWRIVDHLAETRASRLSFTTNGMLLTEHNVDRLVRAPIWVARTSVDAARPDTYRRIRGNEMRKTISGIERLAAGMAAAPEELRGRIEISMVLMRENVEEAPDFVRLAHSLGLDAVYLEHLVDPYMDPNTWVVQRGNFNFNYGEQRLLDDAQNADVHVIRAMDVADELGIQVKGPEVVLAPQNFHHNDRPCREWQRQWTSYTEGDSPLA